MASRGEIYSTRADSENRTYFFNVKENRRGDVFLNIVESSKKEDTEGFDRHQIMVYEEDIKAFMAELSKAAQFVLKKDELKAKSSPKKYKKISGQTNSIGKGQVAGTKAGPKAPSKLASKHSPTPGSNATNLRRKKVSLRLRKKRKDED